MPELIRSVGRYELVREIGQGGMAVVYLARQTDLARLVAIKELGAFHARDRSLARRFVHEARMAGSLSHPNVVTVFDFFEHEGTPFIAMEYVPRGSLRAYIVRELTLAEAAGVFEGVLAGLAHAETRGIVHRDLKPENLMVSEEGRVKIADFGIAKASGQMGSANFRTVTGATVGTPAYMAPEQAVGGEVGPWTDLYAVGIIAYELFTGRIPFRESDTPMSMMMRRANETIPPAASLTEGLHEGISDWIGWLLTADPAQRPRAATQAWDRLEEIVVELLGPLWRRDAGLGEPPRADGQGASGPATPPPLDLPAGPMIPTTLDVPTGRSTPRPRDGPAPPPPPELTAPPPARRADPLHAPDHTIADRRRAPAPPAPEPPGRRGRRSTRAAVIGACCLAALVAVAVVLASGGGGARRAPARGVALAAGPMRASAPSGWTRPRSPSAVPNLSLRPSAAAAPAGRVSGGSVLIGIAPPSASNAALLPSAFLAALGLRHGVIPQRTVVRMAGGLQAYRYDDLRPQGGAGAVTLFVSPSSAGVLTIACAAPAAGAVASACRSTAATLRLSGATAFPVGPSRAYAARVEHSLGRLASALRASRADMGAAGTAGGQSAAAAVIARAYRTARGALPATGVSPADEATSTRLASALRASRADMRAASTAGGQSAAAAVIARAYRTARTALPATGVSPADEATSTRLRAALRAAQRAYAALSAAAHRRSRSQYRDASRGAERAQGAVAAALSQLARDGYGKLIGARPRPLPIPALKVAAPKAAPPATVVRPTPATPTRPAAPSTPSRQNPHLGG